MLRGGKLAAELGFKHKTPGHILTKTAGINISTEPLCTWEKHLWDMLLDSFKFSGKHPRNTYYKKKLCVITLQSVLLQWLLLSDWVRWIWSSLSYIFTARAFMCHMPRLMCTSNALERIWPNEKKKIKIYWYKE